ncbi:MAG: UbiA family prenyltransferase [Candidatus Thermoplasmatota archaeon]|nr:UbiA family prenyltransferase [Candidatus Thermoplasmatota archaeon]
MYSWIRIIRPVNALMGFVSTYISALVGIGLTIIHSNFLLLSTIAGLCVFLVISAGNIINDISDAETDKINHPDRPIPKGKIKIKDAWIVSVLFFVVAVILAAALLNLLAGLVVIVAIAVLVAYEMKMKGTGLPGNFAISILVGMIFIFGGIAVNSVSRMILLFLMAFLTNSAREIIKDVQDMKGDVDRKTFPMRHGVKASFSIIVALTLAGILFSLLTYFLGIFGFIYLVAVIVADAVFIASLAVFSRSAKESQNFSKLGMILGLVAFTVGGIV